VSFERQRCALMRGAWARRLRDLRSVAWLCLWAILFSSVQGLVGIGVTRAVSDEPLVEVCTPTGLRWVAISGQLTSSDGEPASRWPQGLPQSCVWAMAHVAVLPLPLGRTADWVGVVQVAAIGPPAHRLWFGPRDAERVLLMAPMRAPPI
jgi:hypothetical protein